MTNTNAPLDGPRPWTRIKTPVPIPNPTNKTNLMALSDPEFAILIRDHLTLREATRGQWTALWRQITIHDELADRTLDILETWTDQANEALQDDTLSVDEAKRIRSKFLRPIERIFDQLDKTADQPLAWAGATGLRHKPDSQTVINTLVQAIATHRDLTPNPTPTDKQLWATLTKARLDPR